jgi:predicted DNA-binding antitoxin AbrB/MazE fold protein
MTVKAIYRDGNFVPEEPVDMPEGAKVELTISEVAQTVFPPELSDPEERRRNLEELVERWRNNPWPIEPGRKWTRDELHERR